MAGRRPNKIAIAFFSKQVSTQMRSNTIPVELSNWRKGERDGGNESAAQVDDSR